jgi:LL-diaminopimelate aminotransferase
MKIAQRIQTIPPYLFAEIDKKKEEAINYPPLFICRD